MRERNPLRFTVDAQNDVLRAIQTLRSAMRVGAKQGETYFTWLECEKVLNSVTVELARVILRERKNLPNQRNLRQADEFALKAQLAKAREAVIAVVKDGVLTHSHK